jgi:hypothetical protein
MAVSEVILRAVLSYLGGGEKGSEITEPFRRLLSKHD